MWWYNTKEKYQGEVVQYQGEVVQYQGDLSSTVQSHAQFALAPVVMIQSCFFFLSVQSIGMALTFSHSWFSEKYGIFLSELSLLFRFWKGTKHER